MVAPKVGENIGIFEQHADAAGERLPDEMFDSLARVELQECSEKRLERARLGERRATTVDRVRSVERDPKKTISPNPRA